MQQLLEQGAELRSPEKGMQHARSKGQRLQHAGEKQTEGRVRNGTGLCYCSKILPIAEVQGTSHRLL